MCVWGLWFFFFKQKTAYEIGTGDWSSDVCSSDLGEQVVVLASRPLADISAGEISRLMTIVATIADDKIGRASCRERV